MQLFRLSYHLQIQRSRKQPVRMLHQTQILLADSGLIQYQKKNLEAWFIVVYQKPIDAILKKCSNF